MLKYSSLQYIDEFITLTSVGNYLYAAEELFTSESNLSKHIKALEREVGHQLLNRTGHKLELTDYGHIFLGYAKRLHALDLEYKQTELNYENENASTVKVAVARSMNCDHIVNMLSDHFLVRYPNYRISPGEFSRMLTLSQSFQMGYELVFSIDDKPTNDDYFCFSWSTDQLVAVLPPTHPLAESQSIHLEQLKDETFVLFPEETFLHQKIQALCQEAGFVPRVDFTIHGTSNIAELVSEGVGVSLATSSDVLTLNHYHVAMIPIDPAPHIFLNLYHQKNKPLSKVARCFLDFAIDIRTTHYDDIPFLGPEGDIGNVYFE